LEAGDPVGGGGEQDPLSGMAGGDAEGDRNVGFPGAWRDPDRLQHLRAALPCEVRVTAPSHPLFGLLLAAHQFRRVEGVVFLVVVLPDGSPGTIRVDATDLGAATGSALTGTVLDGDGVRRLHWVVTGLQTRRRGRGGHEESK